VNLAGTMFKIVLIAMFFSVDISYVISELLKREELRRFAKLVEIPEAKDIYRFLARFDEKQLLSLFSAFWARYVSKGEETGC